MKDDKKKNSTSWVLDVAHLARIELDSAEEKKFAGQLGAVLANFEFLNKLNTSNVESTAQVAGLTNVFRDDEIKNPNGKKLRDELLANAAEIENGSIKVPGVFN